MFRWTAPIALLLTLLVVMAFVRCIARSLRRREKRTQLFEFLLMALQRQESLAKALATVPTWHEAARELECGQPLAVAVRRLVSRQQAAELAAAKGEAGLRNFLTAAVQEGQSTASSTRTGLMLLLTYVVGACGFALALGQSWILRRKVAPDVVGLTDSSTVAYVIVGLAALAFLFLSETLPRPLERSRTFLVDKLRLRRLVVPASLERRRAEAATLAPERMGIVLQQLQAQRDRAWQRVGRVAAPLALLTIGLVVALQMQAVLTSWFGVMAEPFGNDVAWSKP